MVSDSLMLIRSHALITLMLQFWPLSWGETTVRWTGVGWWSGSRCGWESRKRSAVLPLWGLCFYSVAAGLSAQASDDQYPVGLAVAESDGLVCIGINASGLASGTPVTLLWVPPRGAPGTAQVAVAEIRGRRRLPCNPAGVENGEDVSYEAVVEKAPLTHGRPYFAGLWPPGRLAVDGGQATADLDGDGLQEEFETCTSREGLHLSVWSGNGPSRKRVWGRYYYLGYDVEPSCVGADFR